MRLMAACRRTAAAEEGGSGKSAARVGTCGPDASLRARRGGDVWSCEARSGEGGQTGAAQRAAGGRGRWSEEWELTVGRARRAERVADCDARAVTREPPSQRACDVELAGVEGRGACRRGAPTAGKNVGRTRRPVCQPDQRPPSTSARANGERTASGRTERSCGGGEPGWVRGGRSGLLALGLSCEGVGRVGGGRLGSWSLGQKTGGGCERTDGLGGGASESESRRWELARDGDGRSSTRCDSGEA